MLSLQVLQKVLYSKSILILYTLCLLPSVPPHYIFVLRMSRGTLLLHYMYAGKWVGYTRSWVKVGLRLTSKWVKVRSKVN
jgi:hypothetical protein